MRTSTIHIWIYWRRHLSRLFFPTVPYSAFISYKQHSSIAVSFRLVDSSLLITPPMTRILDVCLTKKTGQMSLFVRSPKDNKLASSPDLILQQLEHHFSNDTWKEGCWSLHYQYFLRLTARAAESHDEIQQRYAISGNRTCRCSITLDLRIR